MRPEDTRIAAALIRTLRNPDFSAVLEFQSRNTRGGAMMADGQALQISTPAIGIDFVGRAVVHGPDSLAFLAMSGGPWSLADLRRGELHLRREPAGEGGWQVALASDAQDRLPSVLSSVRAASPLPVRGNADTHWFELDLTRAASPGAMWDNTTDIFGVIEDARAALWLAADDQGIPLAACLVQSWWQGYDDTAPGPAGAMGLGEDAALVSVIRFDEVGSAPSLPLGELPMSELPVRALDVSLPVPEGWTSDWSTDDEAYWLWRDDSDRDIGDVPSIRVSRSRVAEEGRRQIRDAGLTAEDVVDALAANDVSSALEGWHREPETLERALIRRADGDEATPARLLTFRPDFDDSGPHAAIDVVFYDEPWAYLIQHLTPSGDELADRYLFERWLEGVRIDPT
jgi:hypothetical protein